LEPVSCFGNWGFKVERKGGVGHTRCYTLLLWPALCDGVMRCAECRKSSVPRDIRFPAFSASHHPITQHRSMEKCCKCDEMIGQLSTKTACLGIFWSIVVVLDLIALPTLTMHLPPQQYSDHTWASRA
jgi:hypothetical protein